jgi:hypothetical protein
MSEEEFAVWQKDVGEPEPGYEEWFRTGVEEALVDTSPDTPHEEVVAELSRGHPPDGIQTHFALECIHAAHLRGSPTNRL